MPSRNVLKQDVPDSYYHVYARGASKQQIFPNHEDYLFFINLFARYLSKEQKTSPFGPYPHYYGKLELLAFCLMNNHFHLLLYQVEAGAMSNLMRSIMTSYSRYFNKKYKRTGSLFESRYKAAKIDEESYLQHISRYIHLNPRYWKRYPYSSIQFYISDFKEEWLNSQKILGLFENKKEYLKFNEDYEEHKQMLEETKTELANS